MESRRTRATRWIPRSVLALALPACALSTVQTRPAAPHEIAVAAASDLQAVLPQIAERFRRSTGWTAALSFGSSGNLFSQIQNGAVFDLFFSADIDYPKRLEGSGQVEPGSLYTYAFGRIVLWAAGESPIDVRRGLRSLLDPPVHRIAIANPAHAPYGRAAVAALQHEGLYDRVRDRLVLGENVSQAAQFVESGNAQAGIVAVSLVLAPPLRDSGVVYEIPAGWHPPIEQALAIVSASREKDAARRFVAFVRSPEIVDLLRSFGFSTS